MQQPQVCLWDFRGVDMCPMPRENHSQRQEPREEWLQGMSRMVVPQRASESCPGSSWCGSDRMVPFSTKVYKKQGLHGYRADGPEATYPLPTAYYLFSRVQEEQKGALMNLKGSYRQEQRIFEGSLQGSNMNAYNGRTMMCAEDDCQDGFSTLLCFNVV